MAHSIKPIAAALGAAFLASSFASVASADSNPFSAQQLSGGYDLANFNHHAEGGCGDKKAEGSCGDKKEKVLAATRKLKVLAATRKLKVLVATRKLKVLAATRKLKESAAKVSVVPAKNNA